MQPVIGVVILAIVMIAALFVSIDKTKKKQGLSRVITFLAYFAGTVFAVYVGMAVFGGILWFLTWLGILLREVIQWLIVAVLYPWQFI
jgi:hypothetical protein